MKKLLLNKVFLIIIIVPFSVKGLAQNEPKILYNSEGNPAPGAMYPRLIRLEHYAKDNGSILATFEHYIDKQWSLHFPFTGVQMRANPGVCILG